MGLDCFETKFLRLGYGVVWTNLYIVVSRYQEVNKQETFTFSITRRSSKFELRELTDLFLQYKVRMLTVVVTEFSRLILVSQSF